MCNFRVGQKVVCISNGEMISNKGNLRTAPTLIVGEVYTITAIRPEGGGVLVAEAAPRLCLWFNPARFRPVVTRKTDISIFKAMLNPHKQEQNA